MRTNELDIGTWLIKTEGDAAAVLAMDATLLAHKDHWLVRETIGLLRRTFSRLDVSSRSLFALIEPGSCFAGTLARTGARLRPQLPRWRCPTTRRARPRSPWARPTSASTRWSPARAACGAASTTSRRRSTPVRAKAGQPLDADAAFALGLVTSNPDDIDWADEIAHRRSRSAWRCRPMR